MVFRIIWLKSSLKKEIEINELNRDFDSFIEAYDFGVREFGKKGFRLYIGGVLRGWDIVNKVKSYTRGLGDY